MCMDSFFICRYTGAMALDSGQVQERGAPSPEEEIKQLEEKLAEKKRVLAGQEGRMPEEHEIKKQVLREYAQEIAPAKPPAMEESLIPGFHAPAPPAPAPAHVPAPASVPAPAPSGAGGQDDAQKKLREEKLRTLIQVAIGHTIASAVRKASAESPYLLDELHDRLAAEFDKLVALKKVQRL